MISYFRLLERIIDDGFYQASKKGGNYFLPNQFLHFSTTDLEELFQTYPVAKQKLETELQLYMQGEELVEKYNEVGINWWDYCAPRFINSYPKYFAKLPNLIQQINASDKSSKNWCLFIGETGVETNQLPCLSLIQFQLIQFKGQEGKKLVITVYQRSADSNLGLPSDIYQIYLISKMINWPLHAITFFIGNAHIYNNNVDATLEMIAGLRTGNFVRPKFNLNV